MSLESSYDSDCTVPELEPIEDPRLSIESEDAEKDVLLGLAAFTNKLYQIKAQRPGNFFFSPLSLHVALCMTYQGAKRKTAQVLKDALGVPNADVTAVGCKAVIDNFDIIQARGGLYMANKIYVKDKVTISEPFKYTMREYFYTTIDAVDFGEKEETVEAINTWVENNSSHAIKHIVDDETIRPDTDMLLINSISYKTRWKGKFASLHHDCVYYLGDGTITTAKMLKGRTQAFYRDAEELQAEVLAIRFRNKLMRLVIILPREISGLANLEAKLANKKLTELNNNLRPVTVDLTMPKFQIDEHIMDLEDDLCLLGLQEIFNEEDASFDGMFHQKTNKDTLGLTKVIQKADFVITGEKRRRPEEGAPNVDLDTVPFLVDHPAVFIIMESDVPETTTILFVGRIVDPGTMSNIDKEPKM